MTDRLADAIETAFAPLADLNARAAAANEVNELIALFDAALALRADVTLFERDTPAAEYVARLWAAEHPELSVEVSSHEFGGPTWQVVHVWLGTKSIIGIHRTEARP